MSVTAARGFRAGSATAGLKPSGRPDVALVVNDGPRDAVAAVFTRNRARAHPVLWSEQVVRSGSARALAVNAGNANCYTGPDGFLVTHRTAEHVAAVLSSLSPGGPEVGGGDVVVCSTGIIGVPLDGGLLLGGLDAAAASLSPDDAASEAAARAIMTTDTRPKAAVHRDPSGWTVGGIAKGAGMLAPALATMLVHLTTDADLDAAALDRALRAATRVTFDRLDSDGCMSTNDTVSLMASGASGVVPDEAAFTAALTDLCRDLGRQLLSDAEGAEHDVAIRVAGAASEDEAVEVGRAVARSALVKTAVFGRDPNWGRILAAVGTTGAAFDPLEVDVAVNGVLVCRAGGPGEDRDRVDLSGRDVEIVVDLHAGASDATVWTNDLTHAYVHENSAYTT
ncbi:bifunctional glutamate N-acetyltransferase/amino-acid acetyltransferase ArgJ [Aquipuribacter nitratireducens]|uniref:Arginine biosynthesis bifunctional protein ArgJ n=1 Tax=Aquipuribacter nitratireducens TaxID=650104 RepID=A0ABW0GQE0_9MICO